MKTEHYTIEKLPNRKNWSLNRKEIGMLIPIAYFKTPQDAKRAWKELARMVQQDEATLIEGEV